MRGRLLYAVIVVVIALLLLGFALMRGVLAPSQLRTSSVEAKVFFANRNATKVVAELRSLPGQQATPTDLILALIKGPTTENLLPTLPEGTKLLGITIDRGTAHVDFSPEIRDNHSGGTAAELMTVYSIVATLAELEEANNVQFLIQGQRVSSIWGHMDTSIPIGPDENFISR